MGLGAKLVGLFTPSGDTIKGVTTGLMSGAKDLRDAFTGESHELSMEELKVKIKHLLEYHTLQRDSVSKNSAMNCDTIALSSAIVWSLKPLYIFTFNN